MSQQDQSAADRPPTSPSEDRPVRRRPTRGAGYTDAQGRPELVMHPDIRRGAAHYRLREQEPDEQEPTP